MTKSVRIYQARTQDAVLALTIEVGSDGTATFTDGDDKEAAEFVRDLVGGGVTIVDEPYLVGPSEGSAYVDAVTDMLSRTSRWIVVPE